MTKSHEVKLSFKTFYSNFVPIQLNGILVPRIHDTPHAHESHVVVSHVHKVSVLSRREVPHLASVLGLLIHEPVAIHHMARHALVHTVAIHDGVTVIHTLVHLTTEALPLVDSHSVVSSVLYVQVDIRHD